MASFGVGGIEVRLNFRDEVGDGAEHPMAQGLDGELAEPTLDEL